MATDRLARQLDFILEIDKAKQILRRNRITGDRRRENDAEHAWHMSVMAMLLAEYGPAGMDLSRVLEMILIHDLVEIDAGDAYIYDEEARRRKQPLEQAAAERIFPLLPADQARRVRALWDEFEARETPEARFAGALDRLHPLLLNFHTEGQAWREHGTHKSQVLDRNASIADGSSELWAYARQLIDRAVERDYLDE